MPTRPARGRSRCCATRSSASWTGPAFPPDSHDAKGLIDILESLPRDLLVQISADDLFEIAIGILGLGERQRVRLFVSRDRLDRFVSLHAVPAARPLQHREPPARPGRSWPRRSAAARSTGACICPSRSWCASTTSCTARTGCRRDYDVAAIEARDRSRRRGPGATTCAPRWSRRTARRRASSSTPATRDAFPAAYRADWMPPPRCAIDIDRIERLARAGATGRDPDPLPDRRATPSRSIRCQLLSATPRLAVRRAADVRAHGGQGRRRAPV